MARTRFLPCGLAIRTAPLDKVVVLGARVAELVDALDLGSSGETCGGSSPPSRTMTDPEVCGFRGCFGHGKCKLGLHVRSDTCWFV